MSKKLYRVTTELTYYAYAETKEEAEDFASEAISDAGSYGMTTDADECTEARDVWGHEDGELVYHDERRADISIEDAFRLATGNDFAEAKKKEHEEFIAKRKAR